MWEERSSLGGLHGRRSCASATAQVRTVSANCGKGTSSIAEHSHRLSDMTSDSIAQLCTDCTPGIAGLPPRHVPFGSLRKSLEPSFVAESGSQDGVRSNPGCDCLSFTSIVCLHKGKLKASCALGVLDSVLGHVVSTSFFSHSIAEIGRPVEQGDGRNRQHRLYLRCGPGTASSVGYHPRRGCVRAFSSLAAIACPDDGSADT